MQREDVFDAEVLVLEKSKRKLESRYAPFAGAFSGILSAFATHPLDVVKTRLQVCIGKVLFAAYLPWKQVQFGRPRSQSLKYYGTFQSLAVIWKEEGIRGLWQGITPTIAGLIPTQTIFFAVYTSLKSTSIIQWSEWFPIWCNSPVMVHASSAATAWLVTSVVTNPLWVVKVRMQTQRYTGNQTRKYDGLLRSFQVILKEEGICGLYRGTFAAMLGAFGAMVQFPIYEAIKNTSDSPMHYENHQLRDRVLSPNLSRIAVASGLSSLLSSITIYPLEVIRSRIQVQNAQTKNGYRGIMDCISRMLRQEGLLAFYKGMGTSLIRTVPNGIIALSSYEMGLRLVHQVNLYWNALYD
ncbi:mitochondrial carrier isoform 1 [Galdieria sulphuraria]|uniref:Mitochondrial carrier isoform 1 n=1 Tax=Galdieria sulphuraria TaxID=130081 RepID=M2XLN1_GALSU|nr:mitochondrial carrier isoform 1 [Galdieria sulphuraria]EME31102.1 mitochondrial carrier isoform 1 [Galdieria sulphuraria]|eukprot:XP_005707622.1 mitochondrial carrier isoform 1 [Galdieria sulphuraria]